MSAPPALPACSYILVSPGSEGGPPTLVLELVMPEERCIVSMRPTYAEAAAAAAVWAENGIPIAWSILCGAARRDGGAP